MKENLEPPLHPILFKNKTFRFLQINQIHKDALQNQGLQPICVIFSFSNPNCIPNQ